MGNGAGNSGSSPLARGLQALEPPPEVGPRIIPARAGFTPPEQPRRWRGWDHPRSRGVYENKTGHPTPKPGSSPLARGLHPSQAHEPTGLRIIPARAGFTVVSMQPDTACQDHPRSRGVYPIDSPTSELARGSSPLARGLLTLNHPQAHPDGIIPARAGFTHSRFLGTSASSDHPRSRGVYCRGIAGAWGWSGSSPLARGLRPEGCWSCGSGGIIPARAGFTTSPPTRLSPQ